MSQDRASTDSTRAAGQRDGRGHPDPEDPGKPDSPVQLTKPSWKYIARKTLREFSDDQCTDLAAALTSYSVLALFPALLAVVSLLGRCVYHGAADRPWHLRWGRDTHGSCLGAAW